MAASLFIVIEGEDPGFDTFVNGQALARNEDALEQLAEMLQSPHLLNFFSADANSMALLEQEGYKLPTSVDDLPPTQWFQAAEGAAAIVTLRDYLAANPRYLKDDTAAVVQEMDEYLTVLMKAADRRLRWHLAVSWR